MSSLSTDDDEKLGTGRIVTSIVCAVLAIAFIVFAGIYATTPGHGLPGFLGTGGTRGHHSLRLVGCLLLGVAFAIAAWFALRYRSLALEEAREAERAAIAEATEAAAAGEQAATAEAQAAGALQQTDTVQ